MTHSQWLMKLLAALDPPHNFNLPLYEMAH